MSANNIACMFVKWFPLSYHRLRLMRCYSCNVIFHHGVLPCYTPSPMTVMVTIIFIRTVYYKYHRRRPAKNISDEGRTTTHNFAAARDPQYSLFFGIYYITYLLTLGFSAFSVATCQQTTMATMKQVNITIFINVLADAEG